MVAAAMKLAIVGGGPSGFYVASRILSLLPRETKLNIHIYDRLWSPHGLVRYGVAPDHPEVKNCVHKFDEAAKDPRLRFFGNVNIGSSSSTTNPSTPLTLPLKSLFSSYTHLLFASGCPLPTLHPSLPPSPTCIPSLSLVHWYTNHPSNPPPPPLEHTPHVSIIGAGNVSLDIARILLTSPDVLAKYDIPNHVLDVLRRSAVKHVSIFARRGPLEAAFTTKELRELMSLPEAELVGVRPRGVLDDPDPGALRQGGLTRQQGRILELLRKGSKSEPGSTPKTWSLEFFRAPIGLTPTHLTLSHTTLSPSTGLAIPTTEVSKIETSLIITSLGFHADPTSPAPEPDFFDLDLGHLRTNPGGRIVGPGGTVLRNVYASGWAANGARGVLARTMVDAYGVADSVVSDYLGVDVSTTPASASAPVGTQAEVPAGTEGLGGINLMKTNLESEEESRSGDPPDEVLEGIERGDVTTYEDWKVVDAEEVRRGKEKGGKERERMGWEEAREFLLSRRRGRG